ncbi:alpha/beta fold hydrolase [Candidatus Parabeggiatoa sp. HSG14]|uniref:esterase/lipase family protein n=1 Tax=Candidatus Parabeggiatoa sp. HSG14 TaxID=3055593 RepID=UPI0025A866B8|nr:alpha/beta fold hydrolase [Thiotrichales bacterium HSG14]
MLLKELKYFIIIVLFIIVGCAPLPAQVIKEKNESVILLHGLSRTSWSMNALESHLSSQGFKVFNIDYPSTKHPIKTLVKNVAEQIKQAKIESADKIHFVTHSLGGIITRLYLQENPLNNVGRVVMISPPNQGSELTDNLKNNWIYQFATGPAGQQLGTESSSIPNQLGSVNFDLGVITGNATLNPFYSYLIPGKDDGKVSVERAKVSGMKDFLVVPHSHTFIMNSKEVKEQVVYFLENGKFRRPSQTSE